MIKIGICGSLGRMGQEIRQCLESEAHKDTAQDKSGAQGKDSTAQRKAIDENAAVLGFAYDKGGYLGELFKNSSVILYF